MFVARLDISAFTTYLFFISKQNKHYCTVSESTISDEKSGMINQQIPRNPSKTETHSTLKQPIQEKLPHRMISNRITSRLYQITVIFSISFLSDKQPHRHIEDVSIILLHVEFLSMTTPPLFV